MQPKRETLRHVEAFEMYLQLGSDRSYKLVAAQFNVSETAVAGWSLAFDWGGRIEKREKTIGEQLAKRNEKEALQARERILQLCRATMARYGQRLKDDKVSPDVGDFVRAAQLELLLTGQPTSREEQVIRESGKRSAKSDRASVLDFILSTVRKDDPNRRYIEALRRNVATKQAPSNRNGGDKGD